MVVLIAKELKHLTPVCAGTERRLPRFCLVLSLGDDVQSVLLVKSM